MKRQIVHTLQKYLLNPPIKLGVPLPGYALLETTGRKTGKLRRTPVGHGRIGNQFWLVAEHGTKAGYVRNIEKNPRVRLKVPKGFKNNWYTGTAHLLLDDDPRERRRWLASQLPSSSASNPVEKLFPQCPTRKISLRSKFGIKSLDILNLFVKPAMVFCCFGIETQAPKDFLSIPSLLPSI